MIYIILAMLFYTAVLITSTFASRALNSTVVTAIVNGVSAILPVILAVPLLGKLPTQNTKFGLMMAIVVGILISFFGLMLNKSFQENKVAIVAPVVLGGAMLLSSLISIPLFKEKVSFFQGVGLGLLGLGILAIIYARMTGR